MIIPAFNAEKWLAFTLESVHMQREVGLEVIVVDDGSTDSTATIVAKFPLVRYLHKVNGGQASARNRGIQVARGEFIAFIDADDIWFPDKLRVQIAMMRASDCAWSYCDGVAFTGEDRKVMYTFGDEQKMCCGDVLEQLLCGNFIPSPSPVVRRWVFEKVGLFNEGAIFRNREDWEMWIRIAEHYKLGLVSGCYFGYRVHDKNNTRIEDREKALASKLEVIRSAVCRNPTRLSRLLAKAQNKQMLCSVKAALKGRDRVQAKRIVLGAIREQPLSGEAYVLLFLALVSDDVNAALISLRNIVRSRGKKLG